MVYHMPPRPTQGTVSRRIVVSTGLAAVAGGAVMGAGTATGQTPLSSSATPAASDQAAVIIALAEEAASEMDIRAVILRVTIDGKEIATHALGESMTGVPAAADMHFRNGAVAISYISNLLLVLVDQGVIGLDDTIDAWLPDLPDSSEVTLRHLANMTAGYPDYVQNADFVSAFNDNPFRHWEQSELIEYGLSTPRLFAPGTNWDYSHTDYVILGLALEAITGQPLDELLRQHVLDPIGLTATTNSMTAAVPEPALHAFSSERRVHLGIPAGTRFYEESTYWNPSWTLPAGAIQTSTIHDLATTAEAIGSGALLSPESYEEQTAPKLVGFGSVLDGCPNCHELDNAFSYGLGMVVIGPWLLQNPLFAGTSAIEAWLPSQRIAIAVATTFAEESFDDNGDFVHSRQSMEIFTRVAEYLAPGSTPA